MKSALLVLLVSASLTGCTDDSPSGSSDAGGGSSTSSSSGSSQTDSAPECVPRDGQYTCLGGTWPVCPPEAMAGGACDASAPACMGCFYKPAGNTCNCLDWPDGAVSWGCVGTGYTCE